jgi:hypothetical protein
MQISKAPVPLEVNRYCPFWAVSTFSLDALAKDLGIDPVM